MNNEKLWIQKVTKNPYTVRFCKDPSLAVELAAVSKNGLAMQYIKDSIEQVQLAAIISNPRSLKYIDNPTNKVQNEAMETDITLIRYVKHPDQYYQYKAVNTDIKHTKLIKIPSIDTQLVVLAKVHELLEAWQAASNFSVYTGPKFGDDNWLTYLNEMDESVQIKVVEDFKNGIDHIKHPTRKAKELHQMLWEL